MKVLKHLNNPTFFSNLSQSYPVQSITSTGLYRAYNSFPPSTIICNPNQIFSNPFTQYNQIPPSIHYSHLPITNAIPANYYSCQSLPINYSVPSLSYPGRYNPISSFSYSSLPTGITYSNLQIYRIILCRQIYQFLMYLLIAPIKLLLTLILQ